MTAPVPHCGHPACAAPSDWLTPVGRRCDRHRPGFDPATSVRLMLTDPAAALAYTRTAHPTEETP